MDWINVDYLWIIVSHSDGTHPLQSIHWWASDVMLNFSKSVVMKKQTWPQGELIFSKLYIFAELLL